MKFEPLTRYSPRSFALLHCGTRYLEAHTLEGVRVAHGARNVEALLADLSGSVLYVYDDPEAVIHTTGALSWTLSLWKNRVTRATHNATGASVVSLRGTLDPATGFEDLNTVLSWLRQYGVTAGSIPSMAWGLFRASLPRSYSCGFDPEIGRAAFYGGRQEITGTGIYRNMTALDIRSAYPSVMGRPEGYALSLREVDPSTTLDPSAAGIAEAEVFVPFDAPHAPLPIRVNKETISFQRGKLVGVWPWCELAAAARMGAIVNVTRSWAPARTADLFGSWWPIAQEGRNLPGPPGQLAKAITNSTWGQFGMVAENRARRTYADDDGTSWVDVPLADHDLPHSWTAHVAAETTGRVRTQLLEAMNHTNPVHIDTDGLLVPEGTELPPGSGDNFGQWRVKDTYPLCEIRGPQLYRWTCPECGHTHEHWHYTTSGIPADEAAAYFERTTPHITTHQRRSF